MGKIKCLECNMILESRYTHDFQKCKCKNNSFVDGGNDYLKVGGSDLSKIEVWDNYNKKWKRADRKFSFIEFVKNWFKKNV